MKHTNLLVDVDTYEELLRAKERFRNLPDGKLTWRGKFTWSDFLSQAVTLLEARYRLLPSAEAIRYNPYVYGAECPNCHKEEYPLRRRKRRIWKIRCKRCGFEYIALAQTSK